jgi:GNAT superfamily N-acetyltransferase
MKLRPYCQTDVPELLDLLNGLDSETYEFIPWTEEHLLTELGQTKPAVLAVDKHDRIAGLAYLRQEWWSETIGLYLQPGPEQEGTGHALLAAIEPGTKTGRLTILIDPREQGLLALFAARGYKIESTSYHMIADLDQQRPTPSIAAGYRIRSIRADEEEQLIDLTRDAYSLDRLEPGVLARWRAEDPVFDMNCVQVAEHEGSLVAVVVGCSDLEYNRHYHARRGYLGPAATLPSHRAKGLSKALTARVMNILRDLGMDAACLYTWETNRPALELTRELGFRVGHEWKVLRRSLPAMRDTVNAGQDMVSDQQTADAPVTISSLVDSDRQKQSHDALAQHQERI